MPPLGVICFIGIRTPRISALYHIFRIRVLLPQSLLVFKILTILRSLLLHPAMLQTARLATELAGTCNRTVCKTKREQSHPAACPKGTESAATRDGLSAQRCDCWWTRETIRTGNRIESYQIRVTAKDLRRGGQKSAALAGTACRLRSFFIPASAVRQSVLIRCCCHHRCKKAPALAQLVAAPMVITALGPVVRQQQTTKNE